jgi:hypothetical protein
LHNKHSASREITGKTRQPSEDAYFYRTPAEASLALQAIRRDALVTQKCEIMKQKLLTCFQQ